MRHVIEIDTRLVIRDVRKTFGDKVVLDGINLDVMAGEVVLLSGSNGSGKTTLMRCLAGLASYEGTATLDGRALKIGRMGHAAIGYLPQFVSLPAWATVDELLTLFGRLRQADPHNLPLPDGFLPPLDEPMDELSGGQRQRVAFAATLLGSPSLLLLDEPAANLDDEGRADVVTLLRTLRDVGTSVLVAAPSPSDLHGLPDRTVRLFDGKLVSEPRSQIMWRS